MKSNPHLPFALLVLCFMSFTACSRGSAGGGLGPATVELPAAFQNQTYEQVSAKTNSTTATTRTVSYVFKSGTTNLLLDAPGLLDLLANSFQTNFPAGAQLLLVGGEGYYFFAVSDASGTNIFLAVNTVLSLTTQGLVFSGVEHVTQSFTTNSVSFLSGSDTEAKTVYVNIRYDDSALATGDGTHSTFELGGVGSSKSVLNLVSHKLRDNLLLPVAGGGAIRGRTCIIRGGTIRATLSGTRLPT